MNPQLLPAFPGLRRRFTQDMVNLYGRVNDDRNLIHYDQAAAEQAGFARPLVHGALVAALLSEACRDYFGRPWLDSGRLKVSFIKPLLVGQAVRTGATVAVRRPEGAGEHVELDVWCRNEADEQVLVGQASCLYLR
jgi:acyl dehydratase